MKKTSQLHNKWTGKTVPELKTIKLKMDVTNLSDRPTSLVDDLRPLWKFTRYTAILPDWCQPNVNDGNTVKKVLLNLWLFLVWFLIIIAAIYDWFLYYNGTKTNSTKKRDFSRVFFSSLLYMALLTQSHVTYYCSEYVSFFRNWKAVEQQTINCSSLQAPKKIVYITSSITPILLVCLIVFNFLSDLAPCNFLKCYYYPMTETLNLTVSIIFLIVTRGLTIFFMLFHDALPALVYSHISCAINRLQVKMEQNFNAIICEESLSTDRSAKFVNEVRQCWRLFDTVSNLTDRANHLFGFIFLIDQVLTLSFICFLTYDNLMYRFYPYIPLVVNICFITRLIYFNLILVNVQSATVNLHQKISSLSIQHWSLMTGKESSITNALSNRILQDPIGAAPMDLYTVELSIFLPLLGLIISNIAVLMQSHA